MSSLKLVLGRAGSGKSEYIKEQAVKTHILSKNAIIIVPEQYSHEYEMQMIKKTGYICESLNVTSFNRLANRVILNSGLTRRCTDNSGRAMLLCRALLRCSKKLVYFKKAQEKTGYINLFLGIISELKKGQVMPETLNVIAKKTDDALLSARLSDIALVYEEYNKLLSDEMSDSDDNITLLASLCFDNEYIKNSVVYIDEFFRFTKNELFCVEAMLSSGADVVVSLCMPEKMDDSVFQAVNYTRKALEKCAQNAGASILYPYIMEENKRFLSSELKELEEAMAKYKEPCKIETNDISLTILKNRYDEVANVVTKIKELVSKGMKYRDIAVIAGDYEGYKDIVKTTFSSGEVPVFVDTRKKLLDHPIVIYIFSVLDLLTGITNDKVSVYMKSGFVDITKEEAGKLENYVLASAINYNDWLNDERFLRKCKSIFAEETDSGEEGEKYLEIKNRILSPIISLKKKISVSKIVAERVNALFDFFEETDLEGKILKKAEVFKEQGKLNLADEYTEVYNIIIETLETLKASLGEEKAGINALYEILDAGFSQKTIGIIPKVYDSVAFGDINRSVIKNPKVLFLIGVNEGYFPSVPDSSGLLSDSEREYLLSCDVSVAPDNKRLIEDAEFSLYQSVNVAKNKLYVSYPIDNDGKGLRPASFIGKLKRNFTGLKTEAYLVDDVLPPELSVSSKDSAYSYVLSNIKDLEENTLVQKLVSELSKEKEYKDKLDRAIKFSKYENNAGKLSRDVVSLLYGSNMVGSVSRFERFSSCPFSFFIEYGLRARERKVLKIEAPDIGSLLHEVVERFSKTVHEKGMSFKTITKVQQKQICDEIIEEMFGAMMVKNIFSSGRIEALKTRLKSLVSKSVWAICEHIVRGEFEPCAFELSFDKNGDIKPVTITLPTGEEIIMIGRIDRVDTFNKDGKLYIKVIDYKSGNKSYSLSDIFNMTTLQLSVYMVAVTENAAGKLGDGEASFGGMFYFKLDDPIENSEPDEKSDDDKSLKAFKMSGLVSSDEDVISAMDNSVETGWSAVIPVYKLKDGTYSRNQSKLLDPHQYEKLKRYIKSAVTKIGQEIIAGNVDIRPIRDGVFTPCTYCKYRVVCGFDPQIHPCRYTKKFSSDDEIWEEIKKEL